MQNPKTKIEGSEDEELPGKDFCADKHNGSPNSRGCRVKKAELLTEDLRKAY